MPDGTKRPGYRGWRETDTERQAKLTEQSVTERQEDKRKKKGTETEKRDGEREQKEAVRGRPLEPE